eukprot:SAG11_NODE_27940_length_327_cov_0.622807_1_plen_85_part_01
MKGEHQNFENIVHNLSNEVWGQLTPLTMRHHRESTVSALSRAWLKLALCGGFLPPPCAALCGDSHTHTERFTFAPVGPPCASWRR